MKKIKDAIENAAFRKKFPTEYPDLPLNDLKVEKASSEHLLTSKNGMHPIFGNIMEEAISVVDEITFHQGSESICQNFKKKKISVFDENGEDANIKKVVLTHVDHCCDCAFVKDMKSKNPSEGYLTKIKDSDIPAVLNFSDSKHLGYREACRRIKSWCDFPGFEKRVII